MPVSLGSLPVNPILLAELEEYAVLLGLTPQQCLDEAIEDWITCTAVSRVERLSDKTPPSPANLCSESNLHSISGLIDHFVSPCPETAQALT